MPTPQCWTAAVTVLCAVWWIFESLPLAATSLVPFAVFPLVGVLTEKEVGAAYGDPTVLLFMGGFMLAQAAEHSVPIAAWPTRSSPRSATPAAAGSCWPS